MIRFLFFQTIFSPWTWFRILLGPFLNLWKIQNFSQEICITLCYCRNYWRWGFLSSHSYLRIIVFSEWCCYDGIYSSFCRNSWWVLRECLRIWCLNLLPLWKASWPHHHLFVFSKIMLNLDKCHFILNEMVANGTILSTSKAEILEPLTYLDKVTTSSWYILILLSVIVITHTHTCVPCNNTFCCPEGYMLISGRLGILKWRWSEGVSVYCPVTDSKEWLNDYL